MRIIDKIKADGVHISFEVFPPKTDAGFESVLKATDGIAELTPSFISVTYGAGGGTSKNTVKIASHIKNDLKIPALAHLTCVSSTKEEVHKVIGQLQKEGIENILALRGDIPQDGQFPLPGQYSHACELIEDIKKMGDFCIGAACYPEGHVEMEHKKDDIRYLKEKVDCGVDSTVWRATSSTSCGAHSFTATSRNVLRTPTFMWQRCTSRPWCLPTTCSPTLSAAPAVCS